MIGEKYTFDQYHGANPDGRGVWIVEVSVIDVNEAGFCKIVEIGREDHGFEWVRPTELLSSDIIPGIYPTLSDVRRS